MQRLLAVFQASVTALICLSALIFSAAEEQPLVSLTVPIAIVAWALVDRRGIRGLGPGWSFALGLAGVGAAVQEFMTGGVEARILAPSHLLAYLVWIVLFQHKENRHYWILLGLTVLQVAIASLLTTASWLGMAVILYASCALWTMGVFTLYRAVQRVTEGDARSPLDRVERREARPHLPRSQRGVFSANHFSTVQNSVHLDPTERLIGWHFTGGALVMMVLALSLSGMFFLFIPRIWPNQYRLFHDAPVVGARSLTGFSEDVKLGDMGQILENDELVMEVTLFDNDTNSPIDPGNYAVEFGTDDPLFRGQVMEFYDKARWQRNVQDVYGTSMSWQRVPLEKNALRQHFRLQPIGSEMLFAAGRVLRCRPSQGGERFQRESHAWTYRRNEDAELAELFEYDAWSSRREQFHLGVMPQYRDLCLQLPKGLERLGELAQQIAPRTDGTLARERADRLVAYLRDSGEFSYSLDLSVDDASVDPVIDFLFNRKQGHCEYFASTLALLLRVSGIPARVVSGFKGGQFNAKSGQFEVRQLHAHLWVEAFLDNRWEPLDPTPAAREESVQQLESSNESMIGRIRSAWEHTWTQGVRLSRADQDRMLYTPIRDSAVELWNAVRDLPSAGTRLGDLLRALGTSPERWISWRGGVVVFVLLSLSSAVFLLVRRLWRLLRGFRGAATELLRPAPVVPFYERFRAIAARAGYERAGPQTPREFARNISQRMGDGTAPRPVEIPQLVTESYYRVRFGEEQLPADLVQKLQSQLDELERQLSLPHAAAAAR